MSELQPNEKIVASLLNLKDGLVSELQPNEKIVASLLNLKDDLVKETMRDNHNLIYNEMLHKINSCLFREYPIKKEK